MESQPRYPEFRNNSENFHPCAICQLLSKSTFLENSFRNTNSVDPGQARHFVRPDLGPNCLQRLSADDTSKQRV